ncbi:MAG: hypothetical protein HDP34_05290 [Clostridia bacterium]|nr:hypothetical protein [Clostridia bacterium]
MITENNSIKTEVSDFVSVQKELSYKLNIVSIVALIIGSAGLLAYFVLGVLFEEAKWVDALLVFAVPFTLGLVFVVAFRTQIKQSQKNAGSTNVYEFFSDCLVMREMRFGSEIAVVRVSYGDIFKVKNTANYLLFFYRVKNLAYPVDKTKLSPVEVNTIKRLLGAKIDENIEVLQLSTCGSVEINLNNNQQST